MAYWVKQSLLMSSDQMIYCSAKQKQYRTKMKGYKIQSGARLPNKAVRTEQLLFLYLVSEQQLTANHEISHYLPCWVASQKSTQHCKSEKKNPKTAVHLRLFLFFLFFLPVSHRIHIILVCTQFELCKHTMQHPFFLLHSSSSSSLQISTVEIQGNLMIAVKHNVCLCRQ